MTNQPELLSRYHQCDLLDDLKITLQDTLKEYGELDLIVEVLQNALDAIDYRRYLLLCACAGKSPDADETVTQWNMAVEDAVARDYQEYKNAAEPIDVATFYKKWQKDGERRDSWWKILSEHWECDHSVLANEMASFSSQLHICIDPRKPFWIDVEDDGVGISNIVAAFRHTTSTKRSKRRFGVRGSHGWGLSAILAMSDNVQVLSRTSDDEVDAWQFQNYRSFATGSESEPTNIQLSLESDATSHLSKRLRQERSSTGTHIRIKVSDVSTENTFGHSLEAFTREKIENFLRMYTPVGQVNDYLLHPAYHTTRESDVRLTLTTFAGDGSPHRRNIPFSIWRFSDPNVGASALTYPDYLNAQSPESHSVHTVHRDFRGGRHFLTAAEIQPAKPFVHDVEERLQKNEALPGYVDDRGEQAHHIPRGFFLALSGGMKAELCVRLPRATSAAFRGFVLSEPLLPTLGRKHVMDQRTAPPKSAEAHETQYDHLRKSVLPKSPAPGGSPAAEKMRRNHFRNVIEDLKKEPPLSESIHTWSPSGSGEAAAMLIFAEVLQAGIFGELKIVWASLRDRYDFSFLYVDELHSDDGAPSSTQINDLAKKGFLEFVQKSKHRFVRYGIGEFKGDGEKIFDDMKEDDPNDFRKQADALDLLVCFSFDDSTVADRGWQSEAVEDNTRQIRGQTHVWQPSQTTATRSRPLPVVSLASLLSDRVDKGILAEPPSNWPASLPKNYYD